MEGFKFGGQWGSILLNGQWKVLSWVANEGSILLSGQWKVPSLVTNGETFCLVANGRF
jgi:hypothetical protein